MDGLVMSNEVSRQRERSPGIVRQSLVGQGSHAQETISGDRARRQEAAVTRSSRVKTQEERSPGAAMAMSG